MKKIALCLMLSVAGLFTSQAQTEATIEAEKANYENCTVITDSKYSGGEAIELTKNNACITFTYTVAERGKYDIYVGYDGLYGEKEVSLSVNGDACTFKTSVKGTAETTANTFIMNQGDNSIVIVPGWTYFRIDYIRIAPSSVNIPFNLSAAPVDPQASESAKKMYAFLCDNFGKKTVSGMMTGDMSSANGNVTQHDDVAAVYQASGKYPALVGFDFIFTTGRGEAQDWRKQYTSNILALAKDTWRRGGLPAFTWHWHDPSRSTDAFYSNQSKIDIADAMNADGSWNTSSTLYQNFIKDIHSIADCFLSLQKDGVACIFRPLHEASGGWFWWGRDKKPEPFIKLFRLIYDEMTSVKGVHNIIWVWNAAENDEDWNPGEAYYDVVSADIYNKAYDYSSCYATFDKLKMLTGAKKLIALSENGPIPDIDKEVEDGAVWSWWMPWYQTWDGNYVNQTSKEQWVKCMGDARVITLEDLSAGWEAYSALPSLRASAVPVNEAVYDLRGCCLNSIPSKGIYIQAGKIHMAK